MIYSTRSNLTESKSNLILITSAQQLAGPLQPIKPVGVYVHFIYLLDCKGQKFLVDEKVDILGNIFHCFIADCDEKSDTAVVC